MMHDSNGRKVSTEDKSEGRADVGEGRADVKACVVCVVPSFNASATVRRAVLSALRQEGIQMRVVVVDHGSTDGTADALSCAFGGDPRFELIRLKRREGELRSASRPLNAGMNRALSLAVEGNRTWLVRLDADDFIATDSILHEALRMSDYAPLVMGLLTFFNVRQQTALLYGPREAYRTRDALLRGGAYAAAHHATLVSAGLLKQILDADALLYREDISYGEDMDLTMRLVRRAREDEMSFISQALMFKYAGDGTISNTSRLLGIWRDMRLVFERNPELEGSLLRRLGIDLLLRSRGRILERARRRWGYPAGQVGFEEPMDYAPVRQRMSQLDEALAALALSKHGVESIAMTERRSFELGEREALQRCEASVENHS
jgi:glycosyltransferase involved in cell wall biosynthesis